MTGPECYQEALRLIKDDPDCVCEQFCCKHHQTRIAEAQVLATLSLAAATALGREGEGRMQPSQDRNAWFDAAAECRKAAQS